MISRAARADLGPLSPGGRFARRLRAADAVLYEEIERRRGEPDLEQRTDVLSLLLRARDEEGRAMTDAELRDELFTMLGAGHETTATGLAFAFELLMRNPPVLARLREEIAAARRRRLPRRGRQGDPAAAPGDRRGRAHAHRAAHGRGLGAAAGDQRLSGDRARAHARGSLPAGATSSAPSASSRTAPSPTRGFPSAAASGAASAPRSHRPRWPRCCASSIPAVELRPLRERPDPVVLRGITLAPKHGVPAVVERRSAPVRSRPARGAAARPGAVPVPLAAAGAA